jgi:hypothetical protein
MRYPAQVFESVQKALTAVGSGYGVLKIRSWFWSMPLNNEKWLSD